MGIQAITEGSWGVYLSFRALGLGFRSNFRAPVYAEQKCSSCTGRTSSMPMSPRVGSSGDQIPEPLGCTTITIRAIKGLQPSPPGDYVLTLDRRKHGGAVGNPCERYLQSHMAEISAEGKSSGKALFACELLLSLRAGHIGTSDGTSLA